MPLPVRELRAMLVATPPGCTTDSLHRAVRHLQFVAQAFGKPAHREFRRRISGLPGGAMMPKMLERLTMWASRWRARCGRNARVACTTPQKLMFISQSICAWSISLELAEQRDAGIVDDDVEAGMGGDRGRREILDLAGLPTSTR